ncbi:MAG: hypothetical protein MRY83_04965 [Flavobacteriales bacterium]|nr:hypothetical protein [Flavobacteriales bacterium]
MGSLLFYDNLIDFEKHLYFKIDEEFSGSNRLNEQLFRFCDQLKHPVSFID